MKTTKQTTEIDETPLTPHVPRRDIQRFNKNDIENYIYEHQHTKGWGPIQTCMVVQQYSDGYCTVITGPGVNGRAVTATAWSGCLTKTRQMDKLDRGVLDDYLKSSGAVIT